MRNQGRVSDRRLTSFQIKNPFHWFLILLLGMAIFAPKPSSGQAVYGSIFGTVTDNTGAVVPDATISVTDLSKNTTVTVQSDASGGYRVQHLIAGHLPRDGGGPGLQQDKRR